MIKALANQQLSNSVVAGLTRFLLRKVSESRRETKERIYPKVACKRGWYVAESMIKALANQQLSNSVDEMTRQGPSLDDLSSPPAWTRRYSNA